MSQAFKLLKVGEGDALLLNLNQEFLRRDFRKAF